MALTLDSVSWLWFASGMTVASAIEYAQAFGLDPAQKDCLVSLVEEAHQFGSGRADLAATVIGSCYFRRVLSDAEADLLSDFLTWRYMGKAPDA